MTGRVRRFWIAALAAGMLLVFGGAGLASAADAGTAADPLITYSYVRKQLLPRLKEYMADRAEAALDTEKRPSQLKKAGREAVASISLEDLADRAAGELAGSVGDAVTVPSISAQRRVVLGDDWAVLAAPGATVTVLDGTVKAASADGGTLIDVFGRKERASASLAAGGYAVVTEKGSMSFSSSGATVLVTGRVSFKVPVTGKVMLDGDARYGETLGADLSRLSYRGELSYLWTLDGETVSREETYTVGAADIGKELTLTVVASGEGCGSASTRAATVAKAAEDAPEAPTAAKVSYDRVTLTAVEGMEYRLGADGKWQTSPVFKGLDENTSYRFYMRRAETATSSASGSSRALAVRTSVRAALTSSVYRVDTDAGRLSGAAAGLTAAKLIAGMDYPAYVKVFDASGAEAAADAAVGTGWKVALVVDGKTVRSVSLVVTGDVNGDGKATLTDFVQMKSHLLGTAKLSGVKLLAGDLNGDGQFSLTDFVNMKSYLLGNLTLTGRKV
ncbi:MAG: dockerin type I repeat-containing protein [Oscillospiraceae bacterium]|nr:dockerin type I repeat-containing protein [Oscillospiraceae bacterium]